MTKNSSYYRSINVTSAFLAINLVASAEATDSAGRAKGSSGKQAESIQTDRL